MYDFFFIPVFDFSGVRAPCSYISLILAEILDEVEKEKLSKISGILKLIGIKQKKQILIFFVCLAISTVLWLLNALGKTYQHTILYPVEYTNIPEGYFLSGNPPENLELKISAYGFTILRQKMNISDSPLLMDIGRLSGYATNKTFDPVHVLSSQTLISRISEQIGGNIKILEIQPAQIELFLEKMKKKDVPVFPKLGLKFKSQYNLSSSITTEPGKVTIEGPASAIDTISKVNTVYKHLNDLKKTETIQLNLDAPHSVTLSVQSVLVKIPVEEYTENVVSIPVKVVGAPNGTSVKLFPSEVKISFMVGLSRFSQNMKPDFSCTVPYGQITEGRQFLTPELDRQPAYITDLKITPRVLEYLIEKR